MLGLVLIGKIIAKNMVECKPYNAGENNVMKRPEQRKRMSELAKRRYRINNTDGSWKWGYRTT